MADSEITITEQAESGSYANVDTKALTGVSAKTVHRQIACLGSPVTFAAVAEVVNTAPSTEYGLVTRPIIQSEKADNAAFGFQSSKVMVAGAAYAANPLLQLPADGDAVALRCDAVGNLATVLRDTLGQAFGTQSNPLWTTHPSGTAVQIVDQQFDSLNINSDGTMDVKERSTKVDDAAFTPATDRVMPAGFIFDDVTPDAVDEGDAGYARMTQNRAVHVNVRDEAGDSCMDGTNNALRVNVVAGSTSGTQYTEDAPSAADPIGEVIIGRRRDALSGTEVSADGDNIALNATAKGELYVKHVDSVPVTDGAGSLTVDSAQLPSALVSGRLDVNVGNTPAVTGSGTFNTQDAAVKTDDAAFTGATDKVMMIGAQYDDTATNLPDENDAIALRCDIFRSLFVSLRDTVGSAIASTNGKLQVITDINSAITIADSQLDVLNVNTDGSINVKDAEKVTDNAAFTDGTTKLLPSGFIFDEVAGTALTENDSAAARVDSKRAQVLVLEDETTRGRRATVTAANALKVDNSAVTQPVSGTVTAANAAGDIAHDGVDSGNPVKIGGKASSDEPTAVAAGDRVNAWYDLNGRQIIELGHAKPDGPAAATLTATGDTAIVAAPGVGLQIVVTDILASNGSGTAVLFSAKDGTTAKINMYLAAGGGGFTHPFHTPWRLTANTALNVAIGAAVSSVYVTVNYYVEAAR